MMSRTDKRIGGSPFALFKAYQHPIVGLIVLIVAAAVAEAVGLVLLSALLNMLLGTRGSESQQSWLLSIYEFARNSPRWFLLLLGLTYIGKSLLALWLNYRSFSLALRMTDDWRARLIRAFLRVPLTIMDKQQGAILHVVLDEPTAVGLGLGAAGLLAQNVLSMLMVYAVLLYMSPVVTFGLTVMALAAMATVVFLSRYSRRVAAQRSAAYGAGYAYLTEMVSAIKQIRIFGLEHEAEERAFAHLGKMRELQRKANVVGASPRLLIEIVFLFGLIVMLVVLMPRIGDASVLTALGLAIAAAMRLLPSFSASAGTWVQMQQAWPSMHHIAGELKRLEGEVCDQTLFSGCQQVTFGDRIVVEGVQFSYSNRGQVLSGVDIEIARGEFTAIVGPSGSGKSTLVDLICGFYIPEEGRILIDDVELSQISMPHWRKQLGVVSQDGFLLSGTIRENLCLLRPDCPDELLRNVVALVGADKFIASLPLGYETRVGERGVMMSGGQRQRLALARVLVKEPQVLILDEAMSALDAESEEALQEGLERLHGRFTMIVIAHRLSTLRRADRIYVMDAGRVRESGSHEGLLRKGGLYAAMRRATEMGPVR